MYNVKELDIISQLIDQEIKKCYEELDMQKVNANFAKHKLKEKNIINQDYSLILTESSERIKKINNYLDNLSSIYIKNKILCDEKK